MNPEVFRENFIIPKADELEDALQLGTRRKSVLKYMNETGLSFRFHIYGDSKDFIVSLRKGGPAQDFMFLIAKIFPPKRQSHSPDNDPAFFDAILEAVNGRSLGAIDVTATPNGMSFRAIPTAGRPFLVRKNATKLNQAFEQSAIYQWLMNMLTHTDQVISTERALRTTTTDAMAELFRE